MKKKKNVMYRKSVSLLAAAAMTAVLMTGQVYPVLAEIGNIEANLETSSLIPDNVTIDQPAALSQVALPQSDYGTLSWADGTFVPDKRVQACEVIFKPAENVDLSYLPGWDAQKKVVKGTVNVVVSSLEDTADDTQASSDTAETPSAGESQENGSSDTQAPAENAGETQNPEEAAPAEPPTETPAETPSQEPAAENPDVPAASDSTEDTGNSDKADQPENADTAEKEGNTADDLLKDAPVTEAPSAADAILPDETEADNALTAASGEETKEDTSAKITEAAEEDSTPDQAEEPAASEVPAEDTAQNESAGGMLNDKFGDLMPGATVLDEVEPSENTDEATEEDTSSDEKNIFDNPADFTVSDTRPNTAEDDLTEEEQAARAAENHTCEGITVSGIDLPWYVQFQVESGESYEFKNEEKANIFQSYEFKLWDLKNNTEYEIPDGQYVSVTIPVKEGYEYSIEHLLANGATETIVPSVNGSTMVFSTHSFSPFGIAGFRPIIGDEIANGAYGDNGTPHPHPLPEPQVQELVEQAERLVQTEPQEPALMEQPEPEQTAAMAVQHPVQLAQLIIPEIPAHLETQEILPMQTALPEIVETAAQELAEPLLQTEAVPAMETASPPTALQTITDRARHPTQLKPVMRLQSFHLSFC